MPTIGWPRDALTVQRWLHATLSRGDGVVVEGADRIRIAVDLSGGDIETLDIDATGADLRPMLTDSAALTDTAAPGGTTDADPPLPPPTVIDRRSGMLRHARLNVSLVPAVAEGPADPVRFRIDARATARWKLLRATVRIEARIRVEPSAVVTVELFRIRSRNLLVAALLRIARRDIREYEGKRYDLNDDLTADGTMPLVRDLRVSAGKDVTISARLADVPRADRPTPRELLSRRTCGTTRT